MAKKQTKRAKAKTEWTTEKVLNEGKQDPPAAEPAERLYRFQNNKGEILCLPGNLTAEDIARMGIKIDLTPKSEPLPDGWWRDVTDEKEERPQMPRRLPDDHPHVLALLDESERVTGLGLKWAAAKTPNIKAAQMCVEQGWAFNLAAAWLRCFLKGELGNAPR